jgi:hypothetical protein
LKFYIYFDLCTSKGVNFQNFGILEVLIVCFSFKVSYVLKQQCIIWNELGKISKYGKREAQGEGKI